MNLFSSKINFSKNIKKSNFQQQKNRVFNQKKTVHNVYLADNFLCPLVQVLVGITGHPCHSHTAGNIFKTLAKVNSLNCYIGSSLPGSILGTIKKVLKNNSALNPQNFVSFFFFHDGKKLTKQQTITKELSFEPLPSPLIKIPFLSKI